MKHISLGGLDVSRIGLGTMAMSGYYLDPDSSDAELSPEQIQRLDDLAPATGERHDEANMSAIDR